MGRFYKYKYIYSRDNVEFISMTSLVEVSNISVSTIRKALKKDGIYKGHFYSAKLKPLEEVKGFYYSGYKCSNGVTYRSIRHIRDKLPMTKHYRPYEDGIERACRFGGTYYGHKWIKEKIFPGFKYVLAK